MLASLPGPEAIFLPMKGLAPKSTILDTSRRLFVPLCRPTDGDLDAMSQLVCPESHTCDQGFEPAGVAQIRTFTGQRRTGGRAPYQHVLRAVGLGHPVRDPPHATLSVAELLAEGAILGLGVPAAVRVVEGHVEEEGPVCGVNAEVAGGRPTRPSPGALPRGFASSPTPKVSCDSHCLGFPMSSLPLARLILGKLPPHRRLVLPNRDSGMCVPW